MFVFVLGRYGRLPFRLGFRPAIGLVNLTLEDPDLDAARSERRERCRDTVVYVGPDRLEGDPAFPIPFHSSDLRTAKTAGAVYPDAFCADLHGGLDAPLHRSSKRYAPFELLGDGLGYEGRIYFGLADLDDVDDYVGVSLGRDQTAQSFDVSALLSYDDPRAR